VTAGAVGTTSAFQLRGRAYAAIPVGCRRTD